jgi:hypothetical protein
MYVGLRVKYETYILSTDFRKSLEYHITLKYVQCEPSCSMRTNRCTYRHGVNSRFSKFCERAKKVSLEGYRTEGKIGHQRGFTLRVACATRAALNLKRGSLQARRVQRSSGGIHFSVICGTKRAPYANEVLFCEH